MEQEYQQLQNHLQKSVETMMDSLSKNSLRPLQKTSYLCMAQCLDQNQLSDGQVNQCIQSCGRKSQQVQNVIQNEMNQFQSKIQRCSQVCQDDANSLISSQNTKKNEMEISKIERSMFQCSKSCVDKHITMLPALESKIIGEVSRGGER
jgi:hypothetical protein